MRLNSNIGELEVYSNIYNIGAPSIFNYFSKCVFFFFAIGTCAKTCNNTVDFLQIICGYEVLWLWGHEVTS